MKKILIGLAVVLGLYLIGRAIAEPFVVDVTDPATYRNDWGGPSLPGVLAVHCGPGIVSAALMVRGFLPRQRPRVLEDHENQAEPGGGEAPRAAR
jgi:hypothetical protein